MSNILWKKVRSDYKTLSDVKKSANNARKYGSSEESMEYEKIVGWFQCIFERSAKKYIKSKK